MQKLKTQDRQAAFTLIELMITIVIAAVLLSIAVPSFRDTIRRNRVATQSSDTYIAPKLARSEAAKRGTVTTFCSSTDQATCNGTNDWRSGWVILDADSVVIRVGSALDGGSTLIASAGDGQSDTTVQFRSDGMVNDPTTDGSTRLSLVLRLADCGVGEQRTISISNLGVSSISSGDCP